MNKRASDRTKWLFFDVGSTLVDESAAYEHRLHDIACAAGIGYDEVLDMALHFYRCNQKGDLMTARQLKVSCTPWHAEDERLYPDAKACLEKLHTAYRIGIIANQEPGLVQRLETFGVMESIDIVVSSAEEGVSKPDSRIFEIALEKSGCAPQNAVMIGDRIDNDIVPAKKLGMKTIWVRQGFGQYWTLCGDAEQPDGIVSGLQELCSIL